MSERLLRSQIEDVHGVRRAVHTRGTRSWKVAVFTLDARQRESDIAARFRHLGRVASCDLVTAADPSERRFNVVLVVGGSGLVRCRCGKDIPFEGSSVLCPHCGWFGRRVAGVAWAWVTGNAARTEGLVP